MLAIGPIMPSVTGEFCWRKTSNVDCFGLSAQYSSRLCGPRAAHGEKPSAEWIARMASRHVAVLILYDGNGRILLQHRTDDAPTFPDYWGLFGGGIEQGETPEQAVEREILEELAYHPRFARWVAGRQFVRAGIEYTMHVFAEKYDGSPLTLSEGQGMEWFLPQETATLKMVEHDRDVILTLAAEIRA
jgi:8-oxo-dGTP diphosphatase